jgi:hypothetical protein
LMRCAVCHGLCSCHFLTHALAGPESKIRCTQSRNVSKILEELPLFKSASLSNITPLKKIRLEIYLLFTSSFSWIL